MDMGTGRLTPARGVFHLECLPASGSQWEALTECRSRRMPFSEPQVISGSLDVFGAKTLKCVKQS